MWFYFYVLTDCGLWSFNVNIQMNISYFFTFMIDLLWFQDFCYRIATALLIKLKSVSDRWHVCQFIKHSFDFFFVFLQTIFFFCIVFWMPVRNMNIELMLCTRSCANDLICRIADFNLQIVFQSINQSISELIWFDRSHVYMRSFPLNFSRFFIMFIFVAVIVRIAYCYFVYENFVPL